MTPATKEECDIARVARESTYATTSMLNNKIAVSKYDSRGSS